MKLSMKLRMFFNDEYLDEFRLHDLTFMSSALTRHCLTKLKLSEAECQTFAVTDLYDVGVAKYSLQCIVNLCVVFEVWESSDNERKRAIERVVSRSTKKFCHPYFAVTGNQFDEDLREQLHRESAEVRFEFSADTNEVVPEYKVSMPPTIVQYFIEQLPFIQLDEEVRAIPHSLSEPTEYDFQKIQKAPNVRKVRKLLKKLINIGERIVSINERTFKEQKYKEPSKQTKI